METAGKVTRNLKLLIENASAESDEPIDVHAKMLEIKTKYGPELRKMIEEADTHDREIGAAICTGPNGELHLSRSCWGSENRVVIKDCVGYHPFGSFHTHLGGESGEYFSTVDLRTLEKIMCLGNYRNGVYMLKCVARPVDIETREKISLVLSQLEYLEFLSRISVATFGAYDTSRMNKIYELHRQAEQFMGVQQTTL